MVADIIQEKYITVTVFKSNVEEARFTFSRITAEFSTLFSRLGSSCIELDAEDTSASIKFTALASWTATIKEAEVHNWVALSSKQGIGGLVTLNLILK